MKPRNPEQPSPARAAAVPTSCTHPIGELLTPVVYNELRDYAARLMRREGWHVDVTASDLVDEAVLRIMRCFQIDLSNPQHVIAIIKRGMRQFLVDQARKRQAEKRGGGAVPRRLSEEPCDLHADEEIMIEVTDLVRRLKAEHERAGEMARLRLLDGVSLKDAAERLGVSRATAAIDWAFARSWIIARLRESAPPPTGPPSSLALTAVA